MNIVRLWPCALLLAGCSNAPQPAPVPVESTKPRITQFYTATPTVARGEKARLCYGVENAKEVTIDPPVDRLFPAMSYCFDAEPSETTSYTLTARSPAGEDEQRLTVTVSGKAAARSARSGTGPKFLDLAISAKSVKAGDPVSFCYKAAGADKVTGKPGRMIAKDGPAAGCLFDQPKATTTYTIVISGPGGQDTASTRVTVTP